MSGASRLAARLLLRRAGPPTRGRVRAAGLRQEVRVVRDRWGIPHVEAANLHDLLWAQGWVHARDRLWQMETLRRLCQGRLSEIAGASTLKLDWLCRMSGMPAMRERTVNGMGPEERDGCQAYADGVNACVDAMGRRLPLEFRALKLTPEPWTVGDCASALPYIAFTQTFGPWASKLLAVSQAGTLGEREWNDLLPVHPGARYPHEPWFDRAPGLKLGPLHPGVFALHAAVPGSGSNNWAVSEGADGSPMLANDPHMGVSLPAIWYFCHLRVPGALNAAGTTLAGTPGIVLGRNERVAWSVTNFQLDAVDLLTYRVDPQDPLRYYTPAGERRMREETLTFSMPGGRAVTEKLYRTESGPVITALDRGVTAAAVMKWHGTVAEDALQDRSLRAVFGFMTSASAREILQVCRGWKYVSMNFVAADVDGHIGWQVSGAAPARRGYTGRLPGDASAGEDWNGFLPDEALPGVMDPPEGILVTANYRPDDMPEHPPLSHSWCAPYRRERIRSRLRAVHRPSVQDFQLLQMDVHSGQADRILPHLAGMTFDDPRAVEAARLLEVWDREVRAESAAAAVFEAFLCELVKVLAGPRLGNNLWQYVNAMFYGVENEILDRPSSPLWNGDLHGAVQRALSQGMAECERRMGADRRRWSWGRVHRLAFHHRGAAGRLSAWLLDPASFPAHGDCNTVNVSWWCPAARTWNATTIPSMRLIAAMGDPDGLYAALPLGQSGQPGDRHYDDLTRPWRSGELVRVPLTETGVRSVARQALVLSPR
ncbi:MAG TPA: penicillin acylase family protein [Spirochaetia bacterium]|nr:penicillin acylase family protein [Spirochaetia bacterium]